MVNTAIVRFIPPRQSCKCCFSFFIKAIVMLLGNLACERFFFFSFFSVKWQALGVWCTGFEGWSNTFGRKTAWSFSYFFVCFFSVMSAKRIATWKGFVKVALLTLYSISLWNYLWHYIIEEAKKSCCQCLHHVSHAFSLCPLRCLSSNSPLCACVCGCQRTL